MDEDGEDWHGLQTDKPEKSFSRCAERDIASLGRDSSCYSGVGVTQRATPIAVVAVIGGFTHKRGERVNSAFYWSFRLVCMHF